MAWMAGSCIIRDALGPVSNFLNGTNGTDAIAGVINASLYNVTDVGGKDPMVCTLDSCPYGLHNDMQVSVSDGALDLVLKRTLIL